MNDTTEVRAAWERGVDDEHRRARAASAALIGMALTHLSLAILGDRWVRGLLDEPGASPLSRQILSTGLTIQSGLHLLTAVLFLRWLAKSIHVARDLRMSPPLAWTASEACWGFFIPLLNFIRPYQVIRDLHDGLAPDGVPEPAPRPRTDGVGGYRRLELEKAPASAPLPHASIGAWWALYLLGGSIPRFAALLLSGPEARQSRLFVLAAPTMEVLAAVLAVLVVRAIDGRLAERHRRLHHATDEELIEWGITP